jgi:integrase
MTAIRPIKRHKMNELTLANKGADWRRLKALVLDSVSSPITKRVYNLGLDEFIAWYAAEPRPGLYQGNSDRMARCPGSPRARGSFHKCAITAVRKLAVEAADNGLLAPELANGITRVKGVASKGVRLGNWLTAKQAQALLNAPDASTTKGLRDRAILAVLLGCGLRRSEVAALTFEHIQQRDGRWCIVDLVGKHGRVRTVPMPTWVKVAIDAWTTAHGIADGLVFRSVNRGGGVRDTALSEKVIWQPAPALRRSRRRSRNRAARLSANMRKVVPCGWRGVGADPTAARTCVRPDH